jgi:type 1 glutamine amidotransferase
MNQHIFARRRLWSILSRSCLRPLCLTAMVSFFWSTVGVAKEPAFKVLAFYSTNVEPDHVRAGEEALAFFRELAAKNHFVFDTTMSWNKLNDKDLKPYQAILWLNDFPHTSEQRTAFERYMESGGGWLGLHIAGYNDESTRWPWFVNFLGGAVFFTNNWPVQPAKLVVDDRTHPVTRNLPATYMAPANEWYQWKPSPRLDRNVRVLVTLDPANYPIGVKDVITQGDMPVVWTNTKYRMVYMNMGHGDGIFADPTQNKLLANAILWLAQKRQPAPSKEGRR